MSDLITVQGVVLLAQPVGEYDKRIVLLTRERGKISAFAKGARRQNSPFMAAATPFVFGTFTLFEGRSSYNVNQVNITHYFAELATCQPGVYYGYYFLELADYFGHEGTDERNMMNLLYVTVKALLNPQIDPRLVRCVFELRAMAEEGLMPEVFRCVACGKPVGVPMGTEKVAPAAKVSMGAPVGTGKVASEVSMRTGKVASAGSMNVSAANQILSRSREFYFSQEAHGILDGECLRRASAREVKSARKITPAALYTMQYIVTAPLSRLYHFAVTKEVLWELEHHIHPYVAANTDKRFKSLEILELMIH